MFLKVVDWVEWGFALGWIEVLPSHPCDKGVARMGHPHDSILFADIEEQKQVLRDAYPIVHGCAMGSQACVAQDDTS